jgi:hypothetical protein
MPVLKVTQRPLTILKAPQSSSKPLQEFWISSQLQETQRGFQGLLGSSKALRATPSIPQGTSGQLGNRHRGLDKPRKMPYNKGERKTRFPKISKISKVDFFRNLKKREI